jgi:IS30 family transposase
MSHFTLPERKTLEKLHKKISYEKIGQIIGKVKSSISDEIRNNSMNGEYDAEIAHVRASQRISQNKRHQKNRCCLDCLKFSQE